MNADGKMATQERKDERVRQNMRVNIRVEMVKKNQPMGISRVERRVETRIDPLKAMQVVDFPHIEEKQSARTGVSFI